MPRILTEAKRRLNQVQTVLRFQDREVDVTLMDPERVTRTMARITAFKALGYTHEQAKERVLYGW